MSLISQITISKFQNNLKEKISLLIDPVLRNIPTDPLLIDYVYPRGRAVHIFSKDSLLKLQQQNDNSRQILNEIKQDKTGIFVALKYAEKLSSQEEKYKDFFLKMNKLSGTEILTILRNLADIVTIQEFPSLAQTFLLQIYIYTNKNIKQYIDQFDNLVCLAGKTQASTRITINELNGFYMRMYLKQTEMNSINHGRLIVNGELLQHHEICCPLSKRKINVRASLSNAHKAQEFLAIIVALSQLLDVEDDELKMFLNLQPADYTEMAKRTLLRYLRSPQSFNFSKQQQEFLAAIGGEEQAFTYANDWNDEMSIENNVLSLLIDYTKEDWHYPMFGLFITGHWFRHHHQKVREAIKDLKCGESAQTIVCQLRDYLGKNPQTNLAGDFVKRLGFIQLKLVHTNPLWEVSDTINSMACS